MSVSRRASSSFTARRESLCGKRWTLSDGLSAITRHPNSGRCAFGSLRSSDPRNRYEHIGKGYDLEFVRICDGHLDARYQGKMDSH